MAPPSKRRKLFGTAYTSMSQEPRLSAQTTIAGFSHVIEHIPQPHFTAPPFSLRVEEVHVLQVEQQAALDRRGTVHKRQGTGSAAEAILGVTVVAKVASDGSTTALTTTTDASASLGILAFAGTTTVTSLISPVPSSSLVSAGVAGTSSLSATASSSAKAAGVAGATGSGASSASGSGSSAASSTGLASSSNANTGEGVIGNTPSRAVASSSSAPANGTAGSARISGTASALSPAVITGSSAAPANLTTSGESSLPGFHPRARGVTNVAADTILISGSHTTTSRTTINLDSLNTSTSLRFAAAFYLTTISGSGSTTRVETVSRASTAYPTTFSDGVVLTVSAATGSYVTTTAADGATSTFFMTVTPSASTGTSGPSTIFSTTTPSSPSSSNSGANSAASSLTADGAGAAGSQTSTTTSAASSANSHNSNNNTSPAGTIAGGVVGGAAGLAVILLIAMLFLRWYRRKAALGGGGGHQALRPNIGTLDREDPILSSRQGPGMAERAGLMPAFAAVPALFRHQNRSRESGPGTGTLTTASGPAGTGSERGFTRVSGRKLPSEFSPGMSSQGPPPPPPPPPRPNPSRMPMRSGYGAVDARDPSTFFYRASGASFYSDEHEGGAAGAAGTAAAAGDEGLTLSPGPQRKPTLHEGGHYRMSSPTAGQGPFADPLPGSAGVVESPTGPVGGKGSKFTEQV